MANTTNYSDMYTALVTKSLAKLGRIKYVDMIFIPTGLNILITNIAVVVMILRFKALRTASQFLVSQLAVADGLVGIAYASLAIKRLYRLHNRIPEVNTQLHCCAELWMPYFSQTASLTISLVIALERLVATTLPIFYRHNARRLVGILAVVGWLHALIDSIFMFYGVSSTKIVANCILVSVLTPEFSAIQETQKLIQIAAMIGFYGGVVVAIKYQLGKARKHNQNLAVVKKRIQVKIARMLAVVSMLYVFFQIVARIGMAILATLPQDVRGNYGPFIRLPIVFNSGVNFFVYISLSSEYKNAFRALIGKPVAAASQLDTNFATERSAPKRQTTAASYWVNSATFAANK